MIVLILDRGGPYLPIDTKINFIGGSVWKITTPPVWLDMLQKIAWLDEGYVMQWIKTKICMF